MAEALALAGVGKRVGHHELLMGVGVAVAAGSTVALMGANGAGKSTLLDLVCGLTRATSGRIQVFGRDPRTAMRGGLVGAMLQTGGLLPELTVAETIEVVAALHRRPMPDLAALDAALPALASRRVGACSGGERQRVKWALATLSDPRLLVLDEPTAGMDWQARHDFWRQVARHRERGVAVLYATHYADEVDGIADRVVLLDRGRLVADVTPGEVRSLGSGDVGAPGLFTGLARLVERGVAAPAARRSGGDR